MNPHERIQVLANALEEDHRVENIVNVTKALYQLASKMKEAVSQGEDAAVIDLGVWTVSDDGTRINSDNFDHDVQLKVSGDFGSDELRIAYSKSIARRLSQYEVSE